MELRSLLQILAARWWLVVPVFVITLGAAVVYGLSQRPVYEASAKVVVSPAASVPNDIESGVSLLSRQPELVETYSQIASSDSIQTTAADALKLSRDQRRDTKLTSRVLTGTLLIELTVDGVDATLARDYANAVSHALSEYVRTNSGIFQVAVVDEAGVPGQPVSPNVPLDVALGAVVGLLLGTGLAIVVHLLNPPPKGGLRDVVDAETSAFNGAFLSYRLRQEMSRGRRSHQPLSVALVDVNHQGALNDLLPRQRIEALRRIVSLIDGHLRPEDVSARLEGTVFGVLLPDTSEEQAVPLAEALRARIAAPALGSLGDGSPVHANTAAGVVEFREGGLTEEDVVQEARIALQAAQTGPVGRTEAFSWVQGGPTRLASAPRAAPVGPPAALPGPLISRRPDSSPAAPRREPGTTAIPANPPGSVTRLTTAPSQTAALGSAPPAPIATVGTTAPAQSAAPGSTPMPQAAASHARVAAASGVHANLPDVIPSPGPAVAPPSSAEPPTAPAPSSAVAHPSPAKPATAPAPAAVPGPAPAAASPPTATPSPILPTPHVPAPRSAIEPKAAKPAAKGAASGPAPRDSAAQEKAKPAAGHRGGGKRQSRRAR